jgi:O-antigen/teichoic acid export membrane protein
MLRNIRSNFLASAWFFVLTLVATPFFVHRFGPQVFGLYALLGTFAGYFAMLDLGLGAATIKYVAEHRGRRDDETVGKLIGTALAVYLCLGIVGSITLLSIASFFVRRILDLPAALEHTAWLATVVTAAGLLVTIPLSILNAIPAALQRLDITNRRNILFTTTTAAGSMVLLALGQDVVAVLGYGVIVNSVAAVSFTVQAKRLLPGVRLRPRFDAASFRKLGTFGALKLANQISTHLVYHLDKLLVAALAPLAAVTTYVVSLALAQRLTGLVGNVATAFLPAASEVHGESDDERFHDLYLRATKLVGLIAFPIAVVLFMFGHAILLQWIGPGVARNGTAVLKVLAIAYALNALSTIPALACDSRGRPGITTFFSVGSAALNITLAVILIPHYGALGAGFAIFVNSAVLVPVFLLYVHRHILGTSVIQLVRRSLMRPALASGLIALPAWILANWAHSVPTLLVALAATGVLYLATAIALGTFDAADRALLTLRVDRRNVPEHATVR